MSAQTISYTLSALSDDKSLALFNKIALEPGNTDIVKSRLELTRKQYYSRMSVLMKAGLIIRKNGKYFLTSFGKVVNEAQILIGKAIQNYWKLKAIDSIETSSDTPQLPAEEYNRFIATLIEGNEIKDILIRNDNFATAQTEKVYKNQKLIVSIVTA